MIGHQPDGFGPCLRVVLAWHDTNLSRKEVRIKPGVVQ